VENLINLEISLEETLEETVKVLDENLNTEDRKFYSEAYISLKSLLDEVNDEIYRYR